MGRPRCDVCGGPVEDADLVLVVGPSSAFPPDGAGAVHVGCFRALVPLEPDPPRALEPEDVLEAVHG